MCPFIFDDAIHLDQENIFNYLNLIESYITEEEYAEDPPVQSNSQNVSSYSFYFLGKFLQSGGHSTCHLCNG